MKKDKRGYATDLTDAEWAVLAALIPRAKRGGRPEKYPQRAILNGIRYVTRSGCAWRLLPHDFPPWATVYHYFRKWRKDGTWKRIHDKLRGDVRAPGLFAAQHAAIELEHPVQVGHGNATFDRLGLLHRCFLVGGLPVQG